MFLIPGGAMMEFKIPKPLKEEHEELHAELVKATEVKGKIGESAKAVAQVLHPHFLKEEEYALPPLGLLRHLAEGKVTPEMAGVFRMTDRLKTVLPQLLKEHQTIMDALKAMAETAKQERKLDYARFAEKMMLHARTEEEVLYPASILIGEYLKQKLNPSSKLW
jgi:hemerythrin superfamily protein